MHAVGAAAESLLGPEEMTRIDTAAEQLHPELTDEPARQTLRHHLAVIAITGTDVRRRAVAAVIRNHLVRTPFVAEDWVGEWSTVILAAERPV
ncbi:hypothetical protein AB4305_22465 [Nocardia sp. 2YAB30]|uniref:hypothetical protein n=1 Tax=unclassified Nocardia TaxID=2637762 RepID=UPI003F9E6C33